MSDKNAGSTPSVRPIHISHGNTGKSPVPLHAPDGTEIVLQRDSDGHIIGASNTSKLNLVRTIKLPPWPAQNVQTYTQTGLPPFTQALRVTEHAIFFEGGNGKKAVTIVCIPKIPPGTPAFSVTTKVDSLPEVRSTPSPTELAHLVQHTINGHFSEYQGCIGFFNQVIALRSVDFQSSHSLIRSAQVAAAESQVHKDKANISGTFGNLLNGIKDLLGDPPSIASAVIWGLGACAGAAIALATGPGAVVAGVTLSTAQLAGLGALLGGFDASIWDQVKNLIQSAPPGAFDPPALPSDPDGSPSDGGVTDPDDPGTDPQNPEPQPDPDPSGSDEPPATGTVSEPTQTPNDPPLGGGGSVFNPLPIEMDPNDVQRRDR